MSALAQSVKPGGDANASSSRAAADSGPSAADRARVWREDFPALKQQINGRPLVYLDSAASALKPNPVIDAVARFYRVDYANIHRGAHTLSARATDAYEKARATVQRFINAAEPEEVIFVRGCTEAINLVAASYGATAVGAGDEVIVSEMEHHSNLVPWQELCRQRGATLKMIPLDDRGALVLEAYERLLSPRTKLVAVAHVSNVLGTINPIAQMVDQAHAVGAKVLVDGAQSVVHLPTDVQRLGCDFYAFSAHKLYGPTGVGVLYGKRELLEAMPPYQTGGGIIDRVELEHSTYLGSPLRFEAGTPHIAGAIGLAAAIDYLGGLGMDAVAAHEEALLRYATERLSEVPGLRLIGTAEPKTSVLSFVLDQAHASDVGTLLDEQGVAIRVGHHCAQLAVRRYGVPATARASLALYNNEQDIDALEQGLIKLLELFV